MSDLLQHECGIALVRLLKPLSYYREKYGQSLWGFQKLFLLMEKQHNRGQDGVGIGCTKINMPAGQPYMFRERNIEKDSLAQLFNEQLSTYDKLIGKGIIDENRSETVKKHFEFGGELLMGHLRYGTSGDFVLNSCHPYIRRSNWPTKTLMVQGNFNMTNTPELNDLLISRGQHPVFGTDTQTVLEEIGYHLDQAHDFLYHELRDGGSSGTDTAAAIAHELDLAQIIRKSAKAWDGGYAISGMVGNGDAFVFRDPAGIRPCSYYKTDEVIAFASERAPLMTIFDAEKEDIHELEPGHVATIKSNGAFAITRYAEERSPAKCSFERIYFSRSNDPEIYHERQELGRRLCPQILNAVDNNLADTVVSFVPNTAEIAYHGVMLGLREHRRHEVHAKISQAMASGETLTPEAIDNLVLNNWPRGEKIAHKDIKLRTFISQESGRERLVSHVYDISYGVVRPGDSLVVVDDSIVRGTTLRKSILKILTRTNPAKIVVASTAPQIRYPDCYGIDMAEFGKFIAFEAAISLLKERGENALLHEVYTECLAELEKPAAEMGNPVKKIYAPFTDDEISAKIAEFIFPRDAEWKGEIEVVYQTVGNLHKAIPEHTGDWYFTGNYPTPGGNVFVNRAYIAFHDGKSGRAYDLV